MRTTYLSVFFLIQAAVFPYHNTGNFRINQRVPNTTTAILNTPPHSMKTKTNLRTDAAKVATVLALIIAFLLLFPTEDNDWMGVRFAGSMICLFAAQGLAKKWYSDEKDEKSGLNQAIRDERDTKH